MAVQSGPALARVATSPCNFHRSGGLSLDQLCALNFLQESFVRNLTHSLGAYLRGAFEVAVASIEQLPYSGFLQNIPDLNFVCSVEPKPLEAEAVLDLELPLALSMVDLLLSGPGKWESEVREITEIEEAILSSVDRII
jgi:flagellar motor switch protein FliM